MKKMSEKNNKEKALRKAAALILSETYRTRPIFMDKLQEIAEENDISFEDFMAELKERLYRVGIILREVEGVTRGKKKIAVFGVIDPEIDISVGLVDKTSAAILAIMYVKSEMGNVSLDVIYNEVVKIIGSEDEARKILERTLYLLERKKLIKIDPDKRSIKISLLGQALLPEKEKLDEIIIDALVSEKAGRERG